MQTARIWNCSKKGTFLPMGGYAPDRIYLCTSFLKGKSAGLCKHKSQSQNILQTVNMYKTYT